MAHPLHTSLIRILTGKGNAVGVGFLATDNRLLTCAHVVLAASGAEDLIHFDWPLLAPGETFSGRVVWRDEGQDVACVEVAHLPNGAKPVALIQAEMLWGHEFRAFGFPRGHDTGVWVSGALRDQNAQGWLHIEDLKTTGFTIQPGFSGSPVWVEEFGAVVGMVAAADREASTTRAAFCIPATQLMEAEPLISVRLRAINPYQGLSAFQEQDAGRFFGRETFTQTLLDTVTRRSLVAVVGPSGSGKSSVVYAGLFPQLRPNPAWLLLTLRPGPKPFDALAAALLPLLEPQMTEVDRLIELRKLATALKNGELELGDVIQRLLHKHPEAQQLLLFTDQFEELYTLCEDPEQRPRFIQVLLATLKADVGLKWLLTLRADFMGQALSYRHFTDALQSAALLLGPMNEVELARAILLPAKNAQINFEECLPELIISDVIGRAGALPLLEFALTQLWERQQYGNMTLGPYQQMGAVEGSLARHAEQVYEGLPEEEKNLARQIFIQLVSPGEGTEDTRRRALRAELGEARWTLVQRLADVRLITTGQDPEGKEIVEVAHEALIQRWGRLQEWMRQARRFRTWQEGLRHMQARWMESGRDATWLLEGPRLAEALEWQAQRGDEIETESLAFVQASVEQNRKVQATYTRRQRRRFQAILGAAFVFLILAVLASWQWNEARQQRDVALARQWAIVGQDLFDHVPTGSPLALTLGIESMRLNSSLLADQILRTGFDVMPHLLARMSHKEKVNAVAISPDGQWVVSGSGGFSNTKVDNTVRVWEVATGQEVARMVHNSYVLAVVFSPDGQWVVSGSDDGTARVWVAATGQEVTRMVHEGRVNAVAFSPDGQWVVSGSDDNTVRVWEAATGQEVARMVHNEEVNAVAFSPDGQWVVSGSGSFFNTKVDNTVRVWEVATGQEVARMVHNEEVNAVAFSPDGQWVVSGSGDGTAQVWVAATGQEVARMVHEGRVNAVAFSPDGLRVASGSEDNTVRVWEAGTGMEVAHMIHEGRVNAVVFSPDGQWVVSGSEDDTARVWEVATGQEVARIVHDSYVTTVAFSPDGQWAVSGSDDNTVWVWEATTEQEVARMVHEGRVNAVAFSPDGLRVASGSEDNTVRVWEAGTGREVAHMIHEGRVNAVAFSPDGQWVVSGSEDDTARVWIAATGQEVAHMTHEDSVYAVAFSPDGQWVVSGSGDGTARVWVATTGQEVARKAHDSYVTVVAFSQDGQWVVSGGGDNFVRVWSAEKGQEVWHMAHDAYVSAVTFSPDGRWVVSGSGDHTARVWEATTGQEVARTQHENDVYALAISSDGQWVVSGSGSYLETDNNTVRVWKAASGQEVAQMNLYKEDVTAVAFSPDGQWVISGSDDGIVQVWKVATGQEVARMTHEGIVTELAFSPDGHWVVSGSVDHTVRVWLWQPTDLIEKACYRLFRNLTLDEWKRYLGDVPYHPTCENVSIPEDTVVELQRQQLQGRQKVFFGLVEGFLLLGGVFVFLKSRQHPLGIRLAVLCIFAASLAGWVVWNGWVRLTHLALDLIFVGILILIAGYLSWYVPLANPLGRWKRIVSWGWLLVGGLAGLVYGLFMMGFLNAQTPGFAWMISILEGFWFFQTQTVGALGNLPITWTQFGWIWVILLGGAIAILITGAALVLVARDLLTLWKRIGRQRGAKL